MTVALSVILLGSLSSRIYAQAPEATQTLVLPAGWNLVSIQVGHAPIPIDEFCNAFADPNQVAEIWGYDPSGTPAAPGIWDFNKLPPLPGLISDLTHLEQGKGYWIRIASGTANAMLEGPAWSGTVTVPPGWSLLGFPGLAFGKNEAQVLSDLFGARFDRIQQIWTFDAAAQRFLGYDTSAIPRLVELTTVEPGRAYWVYSTAQSPLTLAPAPFIALPPDADASPPEDAVAYSGSDPRYLGREVRFASSNGTDDPYDYNRNGILDDAETQDTILFEKSVGTATITIGNRGSGALAWTLQNEVPWLFTAPPDERAYPNNEGRPRNSSGTVSSENDLIILYADRGSRNPGRLGPETITLWVGDVPRVITVYADVPDVSGDWSGVAQTTRVNGQEVSLGRVRLVLNAFLRSDEEGNRDGTQNEGDGIRAVMDREKAILFPRDVFLEGVFYNSSSFQLNTNFEMLAGDRNAPPFASFPGDPGDRDFNGNERVDLMNPFPFGIRREVTLLGTRVSPDRLEGTYIESIRGMLPPLSDNKLVDDEDRFRDELFLQTSQPIIIEGDFVLERQTFEPTKRSVFNETVTLNAGIGGGDAQSRTATLNVDTGFTVQGVTVSFDLEFRDPALLRISLTAPDGVTSHLVHNFGDGVLPDGPIAISKGVFDGVQGLGDWTLQVEWDTSERGQLISWGLNLEGVSTHIVSGRVVEDGVPLGNVTLRLEGSVRGIPPLVSEDGTFQFEDLTENDYTLIVSKPGYQEHAEPFFIGESDKILDDIELRRLDEVLGLTEPQLRAAPTIGFEKLTTVLTVLKPVSVQANGIVWNFGDGLSLGGPLEGGVLGDLSTIEHTYEKAGVFAATATLFMDATPVSELLTSEITVLRSRPDGGLSQAQIVLGSFVGALGARMDPAANAPGASPVVPLIVLDPDGSNPGADSAAVYQESKWDIASFDLDRPPIRTSDSPFDSGAEDSDFFGQSYVYRDPNGPVASYDSSVKLLSAYVRGVNDPPFPIPAIDDHEGQFSIDELLEGSRKPTRFRMQVTLGGAVFSPRPQSLGGLTIHPGRTIRPPSE